MSSAMVDDTLLFACSSTLSKNRPDCCPAKAMRIAQTPSSKCNVRALQTQIETQQSEDTPPEATRSKEPLRESSKSSTEPSPSQRKQLCLYHKSPGYLLTDCRSFRKLPFSERKKFVFESKICFCASVTTEPPLAPAM